MLKGIPSILPPELLKILMEMGHGDELVIGDGNFPAASCAQRLVRCDGHRVPELLEAILRLFPLDSPETQPIRVMQTADGTRPPIWDRYEDIVKRHETVPQVLTPVERFAFYEQTKKAYVVISTGEAALHANVLLKKGLILE